MEVCVCFGGEERCPAERGGGAPSSPNSGNRVKKGKQDIYI